MLWVLRNLHAGGLGADALGLRALASSVTERRDRVYFAAPPSAALL